MKYFCIEDFKIEIEKLRKIRATRDTIDKDIIECIFDKTANELRAGTLLNNNNNKPYIKKRINGSGGLRLYYYLLVVEEKIFLMFIHPKTGSIGSDNITDEHKAAIFKKTVSCISTNDLYNVSCCDRKENLIFTIPKVEILES
jgi:hypothetical protein